MMPEKINYEQEHHDSSLLKNSLRSRHQEDNNSKVLLSCTFTNQSNNVIELIINVLSSAKLANLQYLNLTNYNPQLHKFSTTLNITPMI